MGIVVSVMAFLGVISIFMAYRDFVDKWLSSVFSVVGILLIVVSFFLNIMYLNGIEDVENVDGKGNVGVAVVMVLTGEDAEFLGVEEDSGLLLVKTESSVYKVAVDQEDVNRVEYVLHGDEVIYERGGNEIE